MPDVVAAFLFQAAIGLTLPIGAIAARYWHGPSPVVGVMTAFGAGALISGVGVDLVGEALERGTFANLGIGAVIGGVVFTTLNALINARGGFLRKASTTITYLKARQLRRRWEKLRDLNRVPWFQDLPRDELARIAALLSEREYEQGAHIHRVGDRSEHLTIVSSGRVESVSEDEDRTIISNDALGWASFLTGAPHTTTVIPLEDCEVYQLPRRRLYDEIDRLPALRERLSEALANPATMAYLTERHGLHKDEITAWLEAIGTEGLGQRIVDADRPTRARLVELIRNAAWTKELDDDDLDALAEQLYLVTYNDGEVLYQRGDRGDRLFIVEVGEVLVVPPTESNHARRMHAGELFGSHAFATGVTRRGTAIASGDAQVWVMRRRDLDRLLARRPNVRRAWASHVASDATMEYLRSAHGFGADYAASVVRRAEQSSLEGHAAPELPLATVAARGAAIAIWLGILLDGVPESFVVGATFERGVPVALVAGMVISNLPEALASSRGMADQGLPWRTVYVMWASIVLITAVVSAAGLVFFGGANVGALSFVEGIAGGAIITVATETMFPEAFERSGAATGLAALAGFLAAAALGVALG